MLACRGNEKARHGNEHGNECLLLPLSEESLVQFNLAMEHGACSPPRRRLGSVSTRHSSRASVSTGKRQSLGGASQGGRVSFSHLQLYPPTPDVHVGNTYRIRPAPGNRFSVGRTLPANDGHLSQMLADLVRAQLKDTGPPRYKLVCQVVVSQHGTQSMSLASRGLLTPEMDNHATAVFQNHSLFCVAVVYGIYYE
uniref:Tctex1 domain containing 4 n=1 Tax=Electrophorus electricus TaxID=8005 RepID=A0A4W4EBI1_ELEEL